MGGAPYDLSGPAGREERDGCAIIAFIDKRGRATHANIVRTIDALRKMGHRSGDIHGEGDGCGIAVDLPGEVWARRLAGRHLSPHLAEAKNFFVGHFLLPAALRSEAPKIMDRARQLLLQHQARPLLEITGATSDNELGPRARAAAPLFWQVGGVAGEAGASDHDCRRLLFRLQLELEEQLPGLHVASLSIDSVIFKLQGVPDLLPRVFPELRDPEMRSVASLGHGRYSTNTLPTVERSQPFSLLGHNGEINTIERLRSTARALGIAPVPGGSDSQDLNRLIEGLIHLLDFDLLEAMEMVFPPIYHEADRFPEKLRDLYHLYRWFFPCSAQGPAAVLARHHNICVGSVDALGLRPLWFGESDYDYFLSSEKGVVDLEHTMSDPRPLAPGEKIAIIAGRGLAAEILDHRAIRQRLLRLLDRRGHVHGLLDGLHLAIPARTPEELFRDDHRGRENEKTAGPRHHNLLAAFGWSQYDLNIRRQVSLHGREVIGSLGHTGPLAAFVPDSLPNIADYCKENVAVVTNPAIDRERETEHFSLRVILGSRPDPGPTGRVTPLGLALHSPLLLGAGSLAGRLDIEQCRRLCDRYTSALLEDVIDFFTCHGLHPGLVRFLDATWVPDQGQGQSAALGQLAQQAVKAVAEGTVLLVLDDAASFTGNRVFLDPALAVAHLHETLIKAGLRRRTGLVVQSGAIRNLHDLMFVLGLGADAVHPHLLWRVAVQILAEPSSPESPDQGPAAERAVAERAIDHTFAVLHKGMEKVMSTMGIHELCGYGRIFTAIGLRRDLVAIMRLPNFCASDRGGLNLAALENLAVKRLDRARATGETAIFKEAERNPRVGRILRQAALGKSDYLEMARELAELAENRPSAIRHLLRATSAPPDRRTAPELVDISVGRHAMPLVIAAMSFGSQGENSFRAYAEAAVKADIVCMNGEGGEIPDMLGRYRRHRGQQIASGRFGVFTGFLNSADFLEIKIGQGAKPGEGGHLPGSKVSGMVARARHCKPGITLISPSNHHDIYSIEDLAQIITELKTVNPWARVSVKIPVTSGIGTIAVGIAKAGADILNISGFEGGTGAAREHAKRFVGLPAEIGVSEAHRALIESGLRDDIEIWADGGLRSGDDVLKMILLGANRVGLGTAALMAIGCISCRQCHLDRCPRGISTQLGTVEEAETRGVRGFKPRRVEEEAANLARLLTALGDELRMRVAAMGETRLQGLVGRVDLLHQYRLQEQLDAADILKQPARPAPPDRAAGEAGSPVVRKPLNYLTRLISDLAMERFDQGDTLVRFAEEEVRSTDRAVGTFLAGAMARKYGESEPRRKAVLRLSASVPGNGLCAFISPGVEAIVEGGCQDGAAKGSIGGVLGIFKGQNILGRAIDGSTGKSFAYGAVGGLFMVQNMADSRACIRLSGADVVFGGRIAAPVHDEPGHIASRAHLKGFAFEYMTGGRVVVLGDPGPWICAGMTGGVIYQCLYPEYDFDRRSVERRLAMAAHVTLAPVTAAGLADIRSLLDLYIAELEKSFQNEEARAVAALADQAGERFLAITPRPLKTVSAE